MRPCMHAYINMHNVQDCDTAPYTSDMDPFPSAKSNYDDIMTYFNETFGFSPLEVCAHARIDCT